eukprot:m.143459 g.143459  ORF g.143459 m.143459 type:complete len:224 (-) comp13207_c0_seq2:1307-1978(-)
MESMESGRICVEEFVVECKKLAAANSSLTWMSLDEDEDGGNIKRICSGYLLYNQTVVLNDDDCVVNGQGQRVDGLNGEEEEEEDDEVVCELRSDHVLNRDCGEIEVEEGQREFATLMVSICFDEVFSIPTIYFTLSSQGGEPLPLEIVRMYLKRCSAHGYALVADSYKSLTQEDHPFTTTPAWRLHPCNTADVMAIVRSTKPNDAPKSYMESYISVVGSLVGL